MTVNFVFDSLPSEGISLVSNLIGSHYNGKEWNDVPYWFEWGNDVNKHLLRDYAWDRTIAENATIKCDLTPHHWDLHSYISVEKDIPYVITADIKLGTASNCNIAILDSEVWTLLGGQSFNIDDHQLSDSEWMSVSIEILPSSTGAIHLHVGGLDCSLPAQSTGTVFIKNLKVKSETNEILVSSFAIQNGNYTLIYDVKQNMSYIPLSEISMHEDEFNVYPVVITTAEHFYCWPLLLLSKRIVNLVNDDKLKILFLCSFEPIKEDFLLIHQQVSKLCSFQNIKKIDNIIFASSDSTIDRRRAEYEKELIESDPTAVSIKFKDVNGYGHIASDILNPSNNIDWLEVYCSNYHNKTYLFLYLNNRITYHRFLLYKQMEYKNLLQYGLYSWNGFNQAHRLDYDPIHEFYFQVKHSNTTEYEPEFINYVRSNPSIKTAKIKDDDADLKLDPLVEGAQMNPAWVANTYFSVVTETHVGEMPSHVTEKIYKLIFCCHPFIVVGPTYHLETLRRYGFKTFPELFDESYDSMLETFEKYNLISNQIKFYSTNRGKKRLKELLPQLRATLEHNRNHLMSLTSDDVWNSLEQLYKK